MWCPQDFPEQRALLSSNSKCIDLPITKPTQDYKSVHFLIKLEKGMWRIYLESCLKCIYLSFINSA